MTDFNVFNRVFWIVFSIALVSILVTYGLYAYVAVSAVNGVSDYCKDKSIAQCLGKATKEFTDEANK